MQIVQVEVKRFAADEHSQRFSFDEDEMSGLVGSVKRIGIRNPIGVKRHGDDYVIVDGHRRFEAAKRALLETVPCIIREGTEEQLCEVTFAENFFRADLSPVELAVAISTEDASGRMNIEQLAAGFRRSKDWVTRQIGITHWPEDVLEAMHQDGLSVSAAANIAQVTEYDYRKFLLRSAVEGGATARTTAGWLQQWRVLAPGEAMAVVEETGTAEPLRPQPPQGPCIMCGEVQRLDAMSHCPMCPTCIREIHAQRQSS